MLEVKVRVFGETVELNDQSAISQNTNASILHIDILCLQKL